MKTRLVLPLALLTKVSGHAPVKQTAKRAVQLLHVPGIFLLCVSCATSAQDAAESPFTLKQVGQNVWAAISNPTSKAPAGGNTGFVIGDDGVAVIDTSASVDADGNFGTETTKQLLATIRKLTKLPVRFVINTHYHLDHVSANAVFVDAGAIVLAHRNVGNAQDVAAFREYLATLRKLVSDAQALRKSGEALADAVMPALSDKYNRWDFFKYLARPNNLETDAELSGKKRIPQAQPTK